ncbi:MAG: glutathione S-transferase family protein [Sphingomonadales bacterium]
MKFFYCPRTRAARIYWLLEELGIDYELVTVDVRSGEGRDDPDFLAASPMGKVPAIVDGEVRMAETAAIALYLADKYSMGTLAPELDNPLRGQYLYWMVYTPAVIEPAMMEKFAGTESNPFQSGWGSFDLMVETLEKGIGEGPWLLGERFSAADVLVGLSANFMKQFGMLSDNPAIDAYVERCTARPAFQKLQAFEAED